MITAGPVVSERELSLLPSVTRLDSSYAVLAQCGSYRVRLAVDKQDRFSLYRLRFLVFNLEMNEGLDAAYLDGFDRDQYDDAMDHLMVEDLASGHVVGTYRLQTGTNAAQNLGYYSAQVFEFAPFDEIRNEIVELGRACIHRNYRSFEVLNLLWRGIALYAQDRACRYMIGCSSLTSQDTSFGSAMYHRLSEYLVAPELRTSPTPAFSFDVEPEPVEKPHPPRLLRAYLAIGAKICGVPAIDREFKTIDFLTLLDLERLAPSARARYLR